MRKKPFSTEGDGGRSVTQRDIAAAAKVHVTTVSLALRNSPKIPAGTRNRIRGLARRMGYRPNPLAVAFVHRRRATHPEKYQGTLAYVTRYVADFAPAKPHEFPGPLFETSRKRANELGFEVDAFDLADYGNDHRRLEKVLRARNIAGLLIAPLPEPAGTLDFDWTQFSAVALGQSLKTPRLDCVDLDHHAAYLLALKECEQRGYRKAGFLTFPFTDVRTNWRRQAGYHVYRPENEAFQRVPPLVMNFNQIEKPLTAWLKKWKPDVLLGNCTIMKYCMPTFQKLGISFPRDMGVVETNILAPRIDPSTNTQVWDGGLGGRIGVNFLVGKLYRNEYGLPKHPQTILASPIWVEGDSLPWRIKRGKRAASRRSH